MKKEITLLLCLFLCSFYITDTRAQYVSQGPYTTLKARILDKETQSPIPFVNVGFIGKGIGSVTNEQGYFELTYRSDEIKESDVIQFSMIGFKTKKTSIGSISSLLSSKNIIMLTPERYSLEEVVLGDTKTKNTTIGNSKIDPERFGYWKNELGLGGEIASKIRIKKKRTQLKSLNVTVLENVSDSIRVRVNVYGIDPIYKIPQNNVLNTAIYHTISRKSGVERIPLSKYKIVIDTDVIVSIELIEIYGDRLGFAVAGSSNKNPSFTRSISQDYWKIHQKDAMAFTLDASYPLEKGAKEIEDRPLPEALTIFWDASAKANNRNLYAEIELIEQYLKTLKNLDVTVHKFAFGHTESQDFNVTKGKYDAVIDFLQNTHYEGTSDYSAVTETISKKLEYTLIFTDGNTLFSELQPIFNNTTFTISSAKNANMEALEEVALYTDGVYLDLTRYTPKKALEYLLKDLPTNTTQAPENILKITGSITSEMGRLEGARIRVEGTFNEVISNTSGTFEIYAQEGDELEIRFPGMKTKKVPVTDSIKMEIVLETEGSWLQEVVLEAARKEEEKKVATASGKKNTDAVGFKTNIITEEDISPSFLTLGDILRRLSSIRVERNPSTGEEIFVNPRAMSVLQRVLPIVVVNGIIYEQIDGGVPILNPQDIASVQFISSLSANALYGTLGRGGVIIVETKSGTDYYAQKNKREEISSLLVKGNDYVADDVVVLDTDLNKPAYLLQLERATTLEEARKVYEIFKSRPLENPILFYTDVAIYFQKWNKNIALRILSNLPEIVQGDIEVLKLMAYHLESFKEDQLANTLYKKILELAPDRIQSYRDLAVSHQQIGNYQEAFELYKQLLANETPDLDFSPLKKTAEFEIMRLLTFHKSKVSFQDVSNELLAVGFKKDRRLVFEWTNPQADFQIQFVNPKGKYFTWEHSVYTNQERLKDELSKGYSIEEFALDDAPPGEWIINVQYLGEDNIQPPSYLKYTLYLNYATSQETKEVKLIKLFQQKDKTTVGTLTLN